MCRPYSKQRHLLKGNESEVVRDKHVSVQWVVLLFSVFGLFPDERWKNIYFQEISANDRKHLAYNGYQ